MKHKTKDTTLNKGEKTVFMTLMFLLLVSFVIALSYIVIKRGKTGESAGNRAYREYKLHYMLITGNDSDFESDFYAGAKEAGEKDDILVENLQKTMEGHYNIKELMEIAIAAKADGIILEADGSEEVKDLIDRASEAYIPVVTAWQDSPTSKRKCFVGMNEYQLGQIYGNQMLDLAEGKRVNAVVLMDSADRTSPDLTYSGIKDTTADKIDLETVYIDREDDFSSEEIIRSLVVDQENRPDILVCLNSVDTLCARLAVVDYNVVGQVQILGYYSSNDTLDGIEKDIISSTVTVNMEEMGKKAVNALYAYRTNKYMNEYEIVEAEVITGENVKEHIKGE